MIKKLIIYPLITLALVYSVHWLMQEGLRKNKSGIYDKYNTLFLNQNSFNSIILGSSRAEMHMDVDFLDSLTGLHSFNAGVSGATTRLSYVILKSYLAHNKFPKTVFFECDFHRSYLNTDTVFNFPRYFPYLDNPVLYTEFKKIDSRFFQFKYNPFYSLPFMGLNYLSPALHGWLGKSGNDDSCYKNGFFKNTVTDNYGHVSVTSHYGYISPETRHYLDSIILLCKNNQCRLIFTMSPVYKKAQQQITNKKQLLNQYENIAFSNHIPLLNYSSDTSITNYPHYFEDNYHMLYSGAKIYTRKIAQAFNNNLK